MREIKMERLFSLLQSCNIYLLLLLSAESWSQDIDWEKLDYDIFLKDTTTNLTGSNNAANSYNPRNYSDNNQVKSSENNKNSYNKSGNKSLNSNTIEDNDIYNRISGTHIEPNGEETEIIPTYENGNKRKWKDDGITETIADSIDNELTSSYSSLNESTTKTKGSNKKKGGKRKRKIKKRQKKRRKISKKMKPNKSSLNNWLPIENGIRAPIENENEEMIGVFKVKRKEINFASPFRKRNEQMNARNILKNKLKDTTSFNNEIKERGSVSIKTINTFPLKRFVNNNQSDIYDEEKDEEIGAEFVGSSYKNTYVPVPLHYPFSDYIYSPESFRQYTVSNTIRKDPYVVNGEDIGISKLPASSLSPKPTVYVASMGEGDYSVLPSADETLPSKHEMKKGKKIKWRENSNEEFVATPTSIDSRNKIPKYNANKIFETQYENSSPKDPISGPYDRKDVVLELANHLFYDDENPYIRQEPIGQTNQRTNQDNGSSTGIRGTDDPKSGSMTKTGEKLSKGSAPKNSLKRQINNEIFTGMTASRPSLSYTNPKSMSAESRVYPTTFADQSGKRTYNPRPSLPATFPSYKSVASGKRKNSKVQKVKDRKNVNVKSGDSGKSEKEGKSSIGNRKETGKYKENGQILKNENFEEERNGNQEEIKGKLMGEKEMEENLLRMVKAEALPTNDISLKEKKAIKNRLSSKSHFGGNQISTLGLPTSSHFSSTLATIPKTSFNCREKLTGYYADPEAACQVFHRCQINGRLDSFLCPSGTLFNQQILTCDYPGNVGCQNVGKRLYVKELFNKKDSDFNKEDTMEEKEQLNNFVDSREQKSHRKFSKEEKKTFRIINRYRKGY